MKAYMCHWCKRIYVNHRPLLCECKSNCFLHEYDSNEEEIKELKQDGAEIINVDLTLKFKEG